MVVRAGGGVLNVVLSALLIFGFGLGVAGAAIGTTVSTGLVTLVLAWGMVGRSYGRFGMEPSPVPVTRSGLRLEPAFIRQLIEISAPEIGRRLVEGLVVFPLLWIAATFGPVIVTAFEVGRRVRSLINSVNWGLSLASSSLVGRHLGANEESEAGAYGLAIVRLSTVVYIGLAVLVVAFAEPIAACSSRIRSTPPRSRRSSSSPPSARSAWESTGRPRARSWAPATPVCRSSPR
jgi:Na+-driven multidrug efflux pump